jgi:hypothetical protein
MATVRGRGTGSISEHQEKLVARAVDDAVGAWQRAHTAKLVHRSVTGRTEQQSARLRRKAMNALQRLARTLNVDLKSLTDSSERQLLSESELDSLKRKALTPAERDHLARALRLLRSTLATVLASSSKPSHRPEFRRGGYVVLARCVTALKRLGVQQDVALPLIVESLLEQYPPDRQRAWLYELTPHQRGSERSVLTDRLRTFMKDNKKRHRIRTTRKAS